jgi:hypothetical protein
LFKLSTLFEGSEQEVSEREFDLARFYLLRIPGIAFAELQQRGVRYPRREHRFE